jgi:hypothetical protein
MKRRYSPFERPRSALTGPHQARRNYSLFSLKPNARDSGCTGDNMLSKAADRSAVTAMRC